MGFFDCKVCAEKEQRIRELKDQILYLRSLAVPFNDPILNTSNPFEEQIEEPVVETPDPQMQELQTARDEEDDKIQLERDQLLNGTY